MLISQEERVCYNHGKRNHHRGYDMLKGIDTSREYITTSQAAKRSGLSNVYLTQLLRKGTLEGFQLAREWLIYTDSLERFLATPRKSGPKGPRKKPTQEHPYTTSTDMSADNGTNKSD